MGNVHGVQEDNEEQNYITTFDPPWLTQLDCRRNVEHGLVQNEPSKLSSDG